MIKTIPNTEIHRIHPVLILKHPDLNVDIVWNGLHRCSILYANQNEYILGSYVSYKKARNMFSENYYVNEHNFIESNKK